jgi:hypothetical protein
LPKKEFRVKREIWNHKYRVVARNSKGQIVNNRGWHTAHDRQIVVDKTFTFQEGARYSYLIKAHDEYGNPRQLTITSSRAVNLGSRDSYERQRLFDEVKSKYIRKDEKYKKLENFSVVARTDLNTRAKKVYN